MRLVLACAGMCLIVGCDKISDATEDVFSPNSSILVARCIERNKDQRLEPNQLRDACAAKYAVEIPLSGLGGRANINWGRVSGTLDNKSKYIVTELFVSVQHKWYVGNDGERIAQWVGMKGLWITPNTNGDFSGFIDKAPPVIPTEGDWTWDITMARGVLLELR